MSRAIKSSLRWGRVCFFSLTLSPIGVAIYAGGSSATLWCLLGMVCGMSAGALAFLMAWINLEDRQLEAALAGRLEDTTP